MPAPPLPFPSPLPKHDRSRSARPEAAVAHRLRTEHPLPAAGVEFLTRRPSLGRLGPICIDGTFYAIKRSKKPISGLAEEQQLLREVRRLSTLFLDYCSRIIKLYTPVHTRRVMCSTWRPCLSGADWCLQSDVTPDHVLRCTRTRSSASSRTSCATTRRGRRTTTCSSRTSVRSATVRAAPPHPHQTRIGHHGTRR